MGPRDGGEMMKKRLLVSAMAVSMAGGTAMPAAAAPWTRGFVVGTYEYAFRYGGRRRLQPRRRRSSPAWTARTAAPFISPMTDQTKIAVARQKWRSQQEIDWIAKPPGLEQVKAPGAHPLPYLGPGHGLSRLQARHRDLCQSLCGR